jgi:hypothetical protein
MIHATFAESDKATWINRFTGFLVMSAAYIGALIGIQTLLMF